MKNRSSIRRRVAIGFSLVELIVVLLVVSLITGAIAIPLMMRIESKKVEQTISTLDLAQAKLLAYASKFGYLPCPATATSNGMEPSPGTDHANGNCAEWQGFLPAAALGWTPVDAQGYATDPWGNRIRYAVANDTIGGITNPFTRVNGVPNAGMAPVSSAGLLRVCGSGSGVNGAVDCGTAPTLTSNAAFVLWSVGPNATTGGTSIHESQNPNPNGGSADRIFVSRDWSNGTGGDFDDVVQWASGAKVAGHLQTAGLMTPSGSGQGGTGGGCSSSSSNSSSNTSNNSSTNNSGPGNSNSNTSSNSSASNNISYGCSGSNSSSNSSNNS